MVLKVERALYIPSPHRQSLPDRDSNSQPFNYKSDSLPLGHDFPLVPTMPFRNQVVDLQTLPSEEADPAMALLCPIRALHIYVNRTRRFRSSEQLFVCYRDQQKGKAVSKQRLTHWIVEAIALAYQSQSCTSASLADICRAAGWATMNTFTRFYSLNVEPISSHVLGKR